MADPQTVAGEIKAFRGINFDELAIAYKQFCGNETVENSPFDMKPVIEFYNRRRREPARPQQAQGPQAARHQRRVSTARARSSPSCSNPTTAASGCRSSEIPEYVQQAFIAAEDKRFYQHKGIDERGLIRAFITNIAEPGRPQGGSTITQQVAKNLLVGDDVSYERKIREMIVASRLDQALSKDEILEVYLNSIYLGRGAWGIDMAARGYFKKPASALTLTEGAMLAAMAKGPAYFSPDRYPERARERYAYVLKRMQEDKVAERRAAQRRRHGGAAHRALREAPARSRLPLRRSSDARGEDAGRHAVADRRNPTPCARPSIAKLQRAAEAALQDGLARYEAQEQPRRFTGPRTQSRRNRRARRPPSRAPARSGAAASSSRSGRSRCRARRLPLYDVHWPAAVVMEKRPGETAGRRSASACATAASCRCRCRTASSRDKLKLNDVIYRQRRRGQEARATRKAELRMRAQGAGRGGGAGEQDRPHPRDGRRLLLSAEPAQPHHAGAAPARLVDQAAHLSRRAAPGPAAQHAGAATSRSRCRRSRASPRTTGRRRTTTARAAGTMTLRRALEQSKNLVTARLLDGGIDKDPTKSLEQICELALEAKIYPECMKNYPFVLGAQALRMIDLAGFYAAIANEGQRVTPYTIDTIEKNGQAVYRHDAGTPVIMAGGDRAAFYPASHHPRRRGDARHGGLDEAPDAASSAARPAPPTTRTTPGSSASPATSPSRSGSATTTPAASDAGPRRHRRPDRGADRRADHPGGLEFPCRRRRRCRRRRPRRRAVSRPCRSTSTAARRLASAKNGGFTEYFRLDANKKLRDTQYRAGRTPFTGARAGRCPAAAGERRPAAAATAGCRPSAAQSAWNGMPRHLAGIVRAVDVKRTRYTNRPLSDGNLV